MLQLLIRDPSGERVFATERTEVLLGAHEGADLRLADAEAAPQHCLLRVEAGEVRLIGLGARATTTVEGRPVDDALLAPGREFAVGRTVIRVVSCAGPVAPAPALTLEGPPAGAPPAQAAPATPAPAAAPASDFAREVRATVAKAPWYLISLAVHVLVLLVLDLVAYQSRAPSRTIPMAAITREKPPEPDLPPDTPLDLENLLPDMDPLEPDVDLDEALSAAVRKDPSAAEISEYDEILPPDRLGIRGGRRPVKMLDKPLPVAKVKGGDETLNKGDLKGEQGRATETVKRDLGEGIRRAKQRLSEEHVIVVSGDFDKIEEVLDSYGWPFTLVSREDLLRHRYPQARILFINCARKPAPLQQNKLAELVKQYLYRGCWVVTSDWSVEPYLTRAFPMHVDKAEVRGSQRDTTIAVRPVENDPLLAGVFPRRGESAWWLEDSSTMVRVTDRVQVLVRSEDMSRRYGSDVVAFKFAYGKGLVVHLLGHFYQKDGNRRGLVAMHRLINNLIIERVKADQ